MSPPSHHQGHHLASHLPVSTAQSTTGHPLDASTGIQPSTGPQKPAHVTRYRDYVMWWPHSDTPHYKQLSCMQPSMYTFLTRQSHLCKIKSIYEFHWSFSNTEHSQHWTCWSRNRITTTALLSPVGSFGASVMTTPHPNACCFCLIENYTAFAWIQL